MHCSSLFITIFCIIQASHRSVLTILPYCCISFTFTSPAVRIKLQLARLRLAV